MGKDKKPAAAPEPPANVPLNQKAGRGHRQRGAGTIITAKAPITTADGITLRLHERLPSQLLHEYCQKEKRALPKYIMESAGGGAKCFKVILEDAKNSKNDLGFCPNSSFESDKVARDYAALLALYTLQRSIPLETKLPEPYRSSWLGMIGGKGAAGATAESAAPVKTDTGKPGSTPAVSYETYKDKNTKQKAKDKEQLMIDKATADWLCDSCGNQNFATLATGAVRTKCFKCQTARGDSAALVAGTGKAAAPSPNSTSTAGIKVAKVPPVAVIGLQNTLKYASKAEAGKVEQDEERERRLRRAAFDALRRANRPTPILLPLALRRALECLYGSSVKAESEGPSAAAVDLDTVLAAVGSGGLVAPEQAAEGGCHELLSLLPPKAQLEIVQELVALLTKEGFGSGAVAAAVDGVMRSPDVLLDDIGCGTAVAGTTANKVAERFGAALREALLEHLCLHSDESALPSAYDARGSEAGRTLQVASSGRRPAPAAEPQRSLSYASLEACGWAAADVLLAREAYAAGGGAGEEYCAAAAAVLLCHSLFEEEDGGGRAYGAFYRGAPVGDCAAVAAVEAALDEEEEALTAIFPDRFERRSLPHSSGSPSLRMEVLSLEVALQHAPGARCFVDMVVHLQSGYPDGVPAVLVRSSAAGEGQLALQRAANSAAARWRGGQVLFQLVSYLQEGLELELAAASTEGVAPIGASASQGVAVGSRVSRRLQRLLGREAGLERLLGQEKVEPDESCSGSVAATDVESQMGSSSSRASSKRPSVRGGGGSFWSRSSAAHAVPRSARYLEMLGKRRALPAWTQREAFLSEAYLAGHRALVVTGETGCGKTTQIPQFILEDRPSAKVLVCQPRRLAAVGVATRVAEEMDQQLGSGTVGYMVRGDSKCSPHARLAFCTYGVLLRRLQEDPLLAAVDYVVLDEIHERGVDSDFALALLMAAMGQRNDLSIIVMSATLSTDKFAKYIAGYGGAGAAPAPVLSIPGFAYPVAEYYKEAFEMAARSALLDKGDDEEEERWGGRVEEIGGRRWKGGLDYDLVVRLVLVLAGGLGPQGDGEEEEECRHMLRRAEGAVLVFVPGVPEISRLTQLLQAHWGRCRAARGISPLIVGLHGGLSPNEQRRVFEPAPRGCLKVVVATNVAEASVTIPDVTVVVDTCRVREMDYDEERGMSALVTKLASQDSLRQRRGRAGRVSEGRCFRLVSSGTYSKLPLHGVPEMLRAPIEGLVLQVKAMQQRTTELRGGGSGKGDGDGLAVLRRCPDPPQESSIAAAVAYLSQIQALAPQSHAVTPLGIHLSSLPCSPAAGKLLLFGCLLGSAFRCSAMAACIGARGPFLSPNDPESREAAARAVGALAASTGPLSDHLVQAAALERFLACSSEGERRRFCRDNWLSLERMVELRDLQKDLLRACADAGFLSSAEEGLALSSQGNCNHCRPRVAAAALCAGLYPQVAKILRPAKRFVETLGGTIERVVDARELRFFVPEKQTPSAEDYARISISSHTGAFDDICTDGLSRVFIHPSSVHSHNATFRSSNFVLYGERVLSGAVAAAGGAAGGKPFIRDVTEVPALALLFFGGRVDAQYLQGTVTVDKWIRFAAPGRLVALVQALRRSVDELLAAKLADPSRQLHESAHVHTLCDVLCSAAV